MARRKAGVSLPDEDIHRFHRVIVVALHLRGLELRAGVVTPGRSSMLEAEAVAAVIVAGSRFGERPATAAGRVRCRFFHDNNEVQVRRLKNGGGCRGCLHCGWCSLRWHPSAPWGFRGPMSRTHFTGPFLRCGGRRNRTAAQANFTPARCSGWMVVDS